jgi:N-sulfoglucosamine sulfohydrolase
VWGSKVADITPNLDRFASQGLIFQNAHVAAAVSQPSRGALATGMYPHTSGVEGFNHTDDPVPTVMSELRSHGYRVGILGKCGHSTPDASFIWDMRHDQNEVGQGRNPQKYADYLRKFIRDSKKEGKPFYFMANSHDPHRPFHGSPQDIKMREKNDYPLPSKIYTPDDVEVPGFLPDIDAVRLELSQYFSSVRRFDDFVGAVLQVLEDEGITDQTAIFLLSDNGMSQPFAKTNAYYNSTRTPLMVRYPGITKAGSVDNAHFVSGIDFMPTVLESLGYSIPKGVDGRSYFDVLKGKSQKGRDKVFTQFYETSGKNRYPMFAVQDAKYLLIYNPWSDGSYRFRNDSQGGIAFAGMVEAGKTDPYIQSRVNLLLYRVPFELYDLEKDPNALVNLATEDQYKDVVKQYSNYLLDWTKRYDPTVTPAFSAFLKGGDAERVKYMEVQNKIPKERKTYSTQDTE